jgi:hypothetical protein
LYVKQNAITRLTPKIFIVLSQPLSIQSILEERKSLCGCDLQILHIDLFQNQNDLLFQKKSPLLLVKFLLLKTSKIEFVMLVPYAYKVIP